MKTTAPPSSNTRRTITVDDEKRARLCARGHVALIDDDPFVLSALTELLTLEGYAWDSYASATNYLKVLSVNRPDFPGPRCVLCDVKLPEMDGLELLSKLAGMSQTPMLLMSGGSSVGEVVSAFRAGVIDFLVKPFHADLLLGAIAKALELSARRQQDNSRQADLVQRLATLTERERKVARCVVSGRTNQDIADQLGIALRTVKLHRHRALEKLGVNTVADLVRLASEVEI